jgi:hypothetical protein
MHIIGGAVLFVINIITHFKNKTVGFGQRPWPLQVHDRHTRTGTCARLGIGNGNGRFII